MKNNNEIFESGIDNTYHALILMRIKSISPLQILKLLILAEKFEGGLSNISSVIKIF